MTITARILGDSIGVGFNASDIAHHWATIVCANYGWTQENRAISSSGYIEVGGLKTLDATGQYADSGTQAFFGAAVDANSRTLWLPGYNDQRYLGTSANGIETGRRAARAALAWRSRVHADKQQMSAWTKTGSWTTFNFPGGATTEVVTSYTSTIGDKASVSVSGTSITVIYLARFPDGGKFTTKIDGVSVGSEIDTQFGVATGYSPATGFVPMAIRYSGLSAGSHTIEVTMSVAGVVQLMFAVGSGEATHAPIYMGGPLLMANYTGTGAPYNAGSDAAVSAYYQMVQDVAAEVVSDGGTFRVPNVNSYYDKAADVDSDTVHPTDQGHQHIADAFIATISSSPSSTPSATASSTPSATPSRTPSSTASNTPSSTPSPSNTPSHTPSSTPSHTPSAPSSGVAKSIFGGLIING